MKLAEFKKKVPLPLLETNLVFLVCGSEILLALKKRGFGVGRWNGVGGKVDPGETNQESAIRETQEEIGVVALNLRKVAELDFYFPTVPIDKHFNRKVVVYICTDWIGEPVETEEMAPQWYIVNDLPFAKMWQADKLYLPLVLSGKKLCGEFALAENGDVMEHVIHETS